jgi:hypothetical protein
MARCCRISLRTLSASTGFSLGSIRHRTRSSAARGVSVASRERSTKARNVGDTNASRSWAVSAGNRPPRDIQPAGDGRRWPEAPHTTPLATLRAALGFLHLRPRAPELRLLQPLARHLDGRGANRRGRGAQGYLVSLSHVAEREWRAQFMGNALMAPKGFRVAPTPWRGVQLAAWHALRRG